MIWRVLLLGLYLVLGAAAEIEGPKELYIVSEFFSDAGPSFYYRVIEVRPEGPDTVVRYIRIAPLNLVCSRHVIVQSRETKLRNTSPAHVVGQSNPCGVTSPAFQAALKRYAQRDGHFEAISFGIVAKCGSGTTALSLPISENVQMSKLKRAHPEMGRLFDLTSVIVRRAFGEKDVFNDIAETDAQELQRSGAALMPGLLSGTYDQGLAEATKSGVSGWKSPSFRELLKDYSGPINNAPALTPQLMDAGSYQFARYIDPVYPVLAKSALLGGKVHLRLTITPSTGEVTGVGLISGHPILTQSAISAAKQWRFEPSSVTSESLNVVLDYSLRCP